MSFTLFFSIIRQITDQQRPRADDGHVAFEDVQQLGELVQGGGTQEFAVFIQASIVGEEVAVFVLLVGHGTELDELEDLLLAVFVLFPRAGLNEEGVALHSNGADDSQKQQNRQENSKGDERQGKVDDALETLCVHMHHSPVSQSRI